MIFLAPPAEVLTACSGSLGQAGEWAISLSPRECWLTSLVQRSDNLALGVCLTSSGMTAQIANICSAQTTEFPRSRAALRQPVYHPCGLLPSGPLARSRSRGG